MSHTGQPSPQHPSAPSQQEQTEGIPRLLRGALWVAVAALIAAAIVCVVWVLLSPEGDVIPRAFLTILLLAAFGGVALADANAAAARPAWFALVSMIGWVVILLAGLVIIWTVWPEWYGWGKFPAFVGVVAVTQAAVWHQRIMWKAHQRFVTGFTRTLMVITSALVVLLVLGVILPLAAPYAFDYPSLYGRILVALTILVAVGTALVPLLTALFGPRRPRPLPWPRYPDGLTPLPALPDGTPDFRAAQTGVPSPGARPFGGAPAQPAAQAGWPAPGPAPQQVAQAPFRPPQAPPAPHPAPAAGPVPYPAAPADPGAASASAPQAPSGPASSPHPNPAPPRQAEPPAP